MSNTDAPQDTDPRPAVGGPVERQVRRLPSEVTDADAPICPWCDRQGWDTCGSYYDTYTCEARL